MKKMIVIAFLLVCCFNTTINAQETDDKINYLIKPENMEYSGFVSFFDRAGTIDGELYLSDGLSAGLIINRNLYLGLYKMGSNPANLINYQVYGNSDLFITDYIHRYKHSGLYASYSFLPLSLVHFSIGGFIGRGKAEFNEFGFNENNNIVAYDRMLVFSPELAVEFNLLKWMKVGISAGYQVVSGLNTTYYTVVNGQNQELTFTNKDFAGSQIGLTLTIGGLNDKVFNK